MQTPTELQFLITRIPEHVKLRIFLSFLFVTTWTYIAPILDKLPNTRIFFADVYNFISECTF
jgi:hypothetical protein